MSKIFTSREERERKHFDELAKQGYAWWGSRTPAGKIRLQRRINIIKEKLDIKSGDKILEFGCGCGDFTEEISNILDDKTLIYGIDLSESQINLAKERIKKPNVLFSIESCTHSMFKDNSFDFIIGKSILHHLNLDEALNEIKRILKPGGKIFFTEPNLCNPQVWLQYKIPIFRRLNQASPDENPFYHWTMRRKLQELNFKNILIKPFDFIHPIIPEKLLGIAQKIEKIIEKTFLNEIAGNIFITAQKSY